MSAPGDQQNHNQAGAIQASDLDRIRNMLADRPRDLLFLELAVQTDLPVQWLLRLKAADLEGLKPNDRKVIANGQGRAVGVLYMSESLHRTWRRYRERIAPSPGDYLIKSQKGSGPLKLASASNMVNEWFETIGLTGPRGLRSLHSTHKLYFAGAPAEISAAEEIPTHLKALKPVHMIPAHEIVYRGLLQAMVSGVIRPGERLVPERIALQMKVSRMPVREALQRLRAAGFVSSSARGRMVVNNLSRNDLEEIQHIRLMLEREAAGKAALRCEETALERLEAIHKLFEQTITAGKIEQSIRYNKEFHLGIYIQSGMPILTKMIESLLDRVSPYLHIELKEAESSDLHIQNTIGNHREMLNGLHERDPNKVIHWLTKDHHETTEWIVKFFDRKN
ncbi:MAG: FCD domain-containing protein [Thermodesulfobacteriota bacterium]